MEKETRVGTKRQMHARRHPETRQMQGVGSKGKDLDLTVSLAEFPSSSFPVCAMGEGKAEPVPRGWL